MKSLGIQWREDTVKGVLNTSDIKRTNGFSSGLAEQSVLSNITSAVLAEYLGKELQAIPSLNPLESGKVQTSKFLLQVSAFIHKSFSSKGNSESYCPSFSSQMKKGLCLIDTLPDEFYVFEAV